jgi:hypothetical protein
MLAERAQAMQRVCFGAEPSEADLAMLGSRERWLVYRDMVRHRLVEVVGVAFARTKEALGQEEFGRVVDAWMNAGGPRTRYLRHVPDELAKLAIPAWQSEAPAGLEHGARSPAPGLPSAAIANARLGLRARADPALRLPERIPPNVDAQAQPTSRRPFGGVAALGRNHHRLRSASRSRPPNRNHPSFHRKTLGSNRRLHFRGMGCWTPTRVWS